VPTQRVQRALDKAERFLRRVSALRRDLTAAGLDEATRDKALVELESLVLIARGSSEADHRTQLTLAGLQSAFESYLAPAAAQASAYAASGDQDALLADEALRELRAEYPDEAARLSVAEVAAAVRLWAARIGSA
jgi:hypothetical protein